MMGDFLIGGLVMFSIGLLINSCCVKTNVEDNMVEHRLAHYDVRTKEYVKDSLQYSENFDTIFVIKKSAK